MYILLSFYFSDSGVSIFVKNICEPWNWTIQLETLQNLITSSNISFSDKYGILYSFDSYFSNQMKEERPKSSLILYINPFYRLHKINWIFFFQSIRFKSLVVQFEKKHGPFFLIMINKIWVLTVKHYSNNDVGVGNFVNSIFLMISYESLVFEGVWDWWIYPIESLEDADSKRTHLFVLNKYKNVEFRHMGLMNSCCDFFKKKIYPSVSI